MEFINREMSETLLSKFNEQRLQNIECDLHLTNGQSDFNVHRCLLRMFSQTIEKECTENPGLNTYHINGISDSAFKILVDYFYTSHLLITEPVTLDLYKTALDLKLTFVQQSCATYFMDTISVENCVLRLLHIINANFLQLLPDILRFCAANYGEIIKAADYLEIPPDQFCSLLDQDVFYIEDELCLLQSIKRWMTKDLDTRAAHAEWLGDKVRFTLIPAKCLVDMLDSGEYQEFKSPMREAVICWGDVATPILQKNFKRITSSNSDLFTTSDANNSGCTMDQHCISEEAIDLFPTDDVVTQYPWILSVLGGRSNYQKILRDIKCYRLSDCLNENTTQFGGVDNLISLTALQSGCPTILPSARKGFTAAALNEQVCVVGGFSNRTALNTMEIYNIRRDEWVHGPPMNHNRSWHGMAATDNLLLVFGGKGSEQQIMSSCEFLDERVGHWQLMPPMLKSRISLGTCLCQNRVYVVGGAGLNCVDAFDLKSGTWMQVSELHETREAPMVNSDGTDLFVVGGRCDRGTLKNVERIDGYTHQISTLADLPLARAFAAHVTFENRILILGGRDEIAASDIIQLYDITENRWFILSDKLSIPRSSCCAVLINW